MSRTRANMHSEGIETETNLLDLDAIGRCLVGEGAAFGAVVQRHAPAVFGLCLRMVKNRAIAEELAQETFAKAYSALGSYRKDARLRHWILRIAVNLCRDYLKAGERRESAEGLDEENSLLLRTTEDDPERQVAGRQAVLALEAAVGRLPPTYREAFLLKHVEELSYEEMQRILGGRVPMLKVRVFRAREMLKKMLEDGP